MKSNYSPFQENCSSISHKNLECKQFILCKEKSDVGIYEL